MTSSGSSPFNRRALRHGSWSSKDALRGVARVVSKLVLAVALWLIMLGPLGAQNLQIPASLQAELMVKVAGFDRNFAARAGDTATILLVEMPNDTESARASLEMKAALSQIDKVGALPHKEVRIEYANAHALAELVRSKRASIVYFGPGFGAQLAAIRDEFSRLDVITFAAVPDYVPNGIVLGVDIISGRPKLLVNLTQAHKQHVAFPASVLNLMKIFQ